MFSPTLMSSRSSFFAYALSAMVVGKNRRRAVNELKLVFSLMSQYGMFEPTGLCGPVATRYLFQNTPVHAVPHCSQTPVHSVCCSCVSLRLVLCSSKSRNSQVPVACCRGCNSRRTTDQTHPGESTRFIRVELESFGLPGRGTVCLSATPFLSSH